MAAKVNRYQTRDLRRYPPIISNSLRAVDGGLPLRSKYRHTGRWWRVVLQVWAGYAKYPHHPKPRDQAQRETPGRVNPAGYLKRQPDPVYLPGNVGGGRHTRRMGRVVRFPPPAAS